MILILNGSFGTGKTTVGRLLKRRIPGSRLYDPEWAGAFPMRLPSQIRLSGSGTDDFQDIDLWRKTVVHGTKIFHVFSSSGIVIVPMAFCRRDYFDEVVRGMHGFDKEIRVFCLKAGLPIILKRLAERGEKIDEGENPWIVRKSRECIEAHLDPHFGEPVETEDLSAAEVAESILKRLEPRKK